MSDPRSVFQGWRAKRRSVGTHRRPLARQQPVYVYVGDLVRVRAQGALGAVGSPVASFCLRLTVSQRFTSLRWTCGATSVFLLIAEMKMSVKTARGGALRLSLRKARPPLTIIS